jgi:single-strand DNA-binding protein
MPAGTRNIGGKFMNSLNSIILEGNLVKDPELRKTPKGTSICNFSVASNRFYKNEEGAQKEVSFFDIETWNKTAESCAGNLNKGRGVRIIGRLKQERWDDKEGKAHKNVKIIAEDVQFKPVFSKNPEKTSVEEKEVIPAF